MATRTDDFRSRYLPVLLIFLAGLLVGWWVIGWWLWPVTYTNALPQDLKSEYRQDYVLMVAESYATTGDLATAQRRLAGWPAADLAGTVTALDQRLAAQNPTAAGQVARLAAALNIPGVGVPQGGAGPAPTPAAGGNAISQLVQRVCAAGLWILLAVLGVLAVAYLWRRWRATREDVETIPAPDTTPVYPAPPDTPLAPVAVRAAPAATEAGIAGPDQGELLAGEYEEGDEDFDEEEAETEPEPEEGPLSIAPSVTAGDEPHGRGDARAEAPASPVVLPFPGGATSRPAVPTEAGPAEATTRPPAVAGGRAPAAPPGLPAKIGEFAAVYHMGEPDYDEAFDINDPAGAYVGQCGLGLTTPVGRMNDQAAALQVWLWDQNDSYTQVMVLISEGAYRDTGLRDQLAGDYPAISVRPRTEFDLESHSLLLRGVVEKLEYAEQEPANGIFAEMSVRLRVYQKA